MAQSNSKNNRERNMKYKTWFDEELGIIRLEIYESFDSDTATEYFDYIAGKFSKEQQRYHAIFLGENAQDVVDKETRRILRERFPQGSAKVAIYGAKPGVRMLAKIILKAMGKGKDTRFCADEKEAVEWLKAEMKKDKAAKTTG
jgi:hypothetical protein